MKILASKREYPTLQEYLGSGEFDLNQRGILAKAFAAGISPKKLAVLANPEFDARQMIEIYSGFVNYNLSIADVLMYANPELDYQQMELLKDFISNRTLPSADFIRVANPTYSISEMRAIYSALISGISEEDVEAYIDIVTNFPGLDDSRAMAILDGFMDGLSLDQIMLYATPMFGTQQMYQILSGFAQDNFSYDQVKLYANSKYSHYLMRAIRGAMRKGATLEELSEIVQPDRPGILIEGDLSDRWGVEVWSD